MAVSTVFKPGNTALITGGASGIGLALAKKCHSYGMNVIIADNSEDNLSKAKQSFGGSDGMTFVKLDASNLDEWMGLKKKIESDAKQLDFLSLNAGVGAKTNWVDPEYWTKILDVNLYGVINGIITFLPVIQAQSSPSKIVITGSKQGITNPPGNPAYNASKAAIKSIAEQLSYDLRDTPISVHLLVPGWVYTGLTGASAGSKKPEGAWYPEQVADYMEKKLAEGKFYIICPDNDVSEELDQKRMLWSAGDIVHGRQPLSRWRKDTQSEAAEWIKNCEV